MSSKSMLHWYYNEGKEQARLSDGGGALERLRMQELLSRFLPDSGIVYDVGGAAGVYAIWLAEQNYTVHLLDLVPLHIEQALTDSQGKLASATVGNALSLPYDDNSADVVLLLGPLYHLTDYEDRIQALRETYRVLKPNGIVVAVAIGRYGSMMAQLNRGNLAPEVLNMVEETLASGQHRNPTKEHGYFTTAYFHRPDELQAEVATAGFTADSPIAIQGAAWMLPDFTPFIEDEAIQKRILTMMSQLEREPYLLGTSPHLMVIGRK